MRGILINPSEKSITEVEVTDNNHKTLMNCDLMDAIRLSPSETMYVDDEGLMDASKRFFKFQGYIQPIAGSGLILACDSEGYDQPTGIKIETLENAVTFITDKEAVKMAVIADEEAMGRKEEIETRGFSFIHISAAELIKDRAYTDSTESD